MPSERILVALSGGVDSAVAAGLLKEAGHDVVAVTLHLWDAQGAQQVGRCCAPADREDARRVAEHLAIPHYVIDERESFREQVVDPFIQSYLSGETPSPCVHCNRTVKVTFLNELADRFGAAKVATGHYARLLEPCEAQGTVRLLRGRDLGKDQSYFLFGVPESVRRRLLFPLGGLQKDAVREHARRLQLPNADKKDSQELCFVPDGDVRGFVARHDGETPRGDIVDDASGEKVGEHDGITGFTVGQRRGLGLGGGPPRFVLRIVPETNRVVVGEAAALLKSEARVIDVTWLHCPPQQPFDATLRIRYRHQPAKARIVPNSGGFTATFAEPQRAVTPGQAAVIYHGDEVVGGGFLAPPAAAVATA